MDKKALLEASLEEKIKQTKRLVMDWYEQFDGQVYISWSGGKDSTVLLHIARQIYPDIEAVFCNTRLEFPEITRFVNEYRKKYGNVIVIKPKMDFKEVSQKYGFPIVSKEQSLYLFQIRNTKSEKLREYRTNGYPPNGNFCVSKKWKYLINSDFKISDKCCDNFKKKPFAKYEKQTKKNPMIGVMAGESSLRKQIYLRDECNAFKSKRPISRPINFWDESDIWKYIRDFNVEISPIYNMGYERTGCYLCPYGHHLDLRKGTDRFAQLFKTHPKLYKHSMETLGLKEVLKEYVRIDYRQDGPYKEGDTIELFTKEN